MTGRAEIAIAAALAAARPRLLAALQEVLPVRFVPDAGDAGRAAGARVRLAGGDDHGDGPVLWVDSDAEGALAHVPAAVRLGDAAELERCLRNATLTDRHARPLAAVAPGARVLAEAGGRPVWTACDEGRRHVAALPDELAAGEALRDRLEPGRCLAMLAFVHFLRDASAAHGWSAPELRAAFVFDDPNLHWPTYGRLRYRELAEHAREHRYHVAMAMVPLDGWLAHPGAARTFRERAAQLSVLVHGNDHLRWELSRPQSAAAAEQLAAEALRRIRAFEGRSGVPVCRVMAPPHERVGEPMMPALRRLGFEGICMTRPYPWLERADASWLARPAADGPAIAFGPAPVVQGLPVLLRREFSAPREDLVLRAFLRQPLIVYGHHEDVAGGLDPLAAAAEDINRLGDVRWTALSGIVRRSVELRRDGAVLHVRPGSRRFDVDVPAGVDTLRVAEADVLGDGAVRWDGDHVSDQDARTVTVSAPGRVTAVIAGGEDEHGTRGRRLGSPWPLARRLASESRDRLGPLMTRGDRTDLAA